MKRSFAECSYLPLCVEEFFDHLHKVCQNPRTDSPDMLSIESIKVEGMVGEVEWIISAFWDALIRKVLWKLQCGDTFRIIRLLFENPLKRQMKESLHFVRIELFNESFFFISEDMGSKTEPGRVEQVIHGA